MKTGTTKTVAWCIAAMAGLAATTVLAQQPAKKTASKPLQAPAVVQPTNEHPEQNLGEADLEVRRLKAELELKNRLAAQDNVPGGGGLRGPGPANDLCAGATVIPITSGGSLTVNDNNTGATNDTAVPACGFTNTSQTSGSLGLWYKITGTGNFITITACNQSTDMTMRVFCGDCSNLQCVGADDDGCVTNSLAPALGFCSASGVDYYVLIHRYGTVTVGAAFAFNVVDNGTACSAPACGVPANDTCAGAISLTIGGTVTGTTAGATDEGSTLCGAAATDNSVWYSVTGDGSMFRASACNALTGANVKIAVFSGACGSLTCVGNNAVLAGCANNARDDNPTADWYAANGTPFYIRVSSDTNGSGAFQLSLTSLGPPLAGDFCTNAVPIAIGGSIAANNTGATNETGLPTCNGLSTWNTGLWYTFTGNGNRLEVTTCDPATVLNTRVYVFSGSCGALSCINANATAVPACSSPSTAATVAFCSSPGTVYYALVTPDTTGTGAFTLRINDLGNVCPANDNCGGAINVAVGGSVVGDTTNASNEAPVPPTCNGLSTFNLGLWYSFTGNGNLLQVTTCDPATVLNTRVYVYTGTCAALTCLNANATADSPACSSPTTAATVNVCSVPGQTYYVLVTNDTTGTGVFTLRVNDLGACLANDNCSGAITVSVGSSTAGSNVGATNEPTLPTCSALTTWNSGVWYKFNATNNNKLRVTTCDPATVLNTRLYVFTTPDCVNFTCVGANATASPACAAPSSAATVEFCGTTGTTYYVLVTNDTTGQGAFQLLVQDAGPAGCIPQGACCVAGACSIVFEGTCTGTYLGNNTTCNSLARSVNVSVPDFVSPNPGSASDSLVVPPGAPTITDLNVDFIMTHTWQGDLIVTLTHVDTATTVTLIDRPGVPNVDTVGFSADNYGNLGTNTPFTLDDEAATTYDSPQVATPGTANVTGAWKPDLGPLSAFDGQSLSGTWTLTVTDNAGGDTGNIRYWALVQAGAGNPCPIGPDCFTRSAGQQGGMWVRGGPNGVPDNTECIGDWDRNGPVEPADIAGFVNTWLFSVSNPGNTYADIDCNGTVEPADIASFVNAWLAGLTPGAQGCP